MVSINRKHTSLHKMIFRTGFLEDVRSHTHHPTHRAPASRQPAGFQSGSLCGRALLFAGPFLGFRHLLFLFSTDSIAHFRNVEFHLQSIFLHLCESNTAAYFAEGKGRREREEGRGHKGLISSSVGHLFHICHMAFISEASEAHQLRKGIWCPSGQIHKGRANANKKFSVHRNIS